MPLELESPFLVQPVPGFTPQVGRLLTMLDYARRTTVDEVEGLDQEQLDALPDPDGNSIGMLLAHVAHLERTYRILTLEEGDPEWQGVPAGELGDAGRRTLRGRPVEHYLNELAEEREKTLEAFRGVDDAWLETRVPWWGGHPANRYFMWFHVAEDEINHRGQIRVLRRRIGA